MARVSDRRFAFVPAKAGDHRSPLRRPRARARERSPLQPVAARGAGDGEDSQPRRVGAAAAETESDPPPNLRVVKPGGASVVSEIVEKVQLAVADYGQRWPKACTKIFSIPLTLRASPAS